MSLLQQYADFLKNGGLIPYAIKGLDYLRRLALGDPPATSGVSEPYVPPFKYGQCAGVYYRLNFFNPVGKYWEVSQAAHTLGAVKSLVYLGVTAGVHYWRSVGGNNVVQTHGYGGSVQKPIEIEWRRADGLPDTCGDIPNPNPAPPVSSDGLADSSAPNFSGPNAEPIITGTPLADDGSDDLADDAISDTVDAGALAPTDLPGAIAKVAAALGKLIQLVSLLNELVELLKKLFAKENKSSFSYNFGNLRYDGFIRIQSEPPTDKISPLYLDLQATSVKAGASRIFGEKSPNYYNREPIGYIHFVSATFGILSSHEIRFIRTSIAIPELAYGFFYNLGLDGVNRANATGFYLKQEE